MVTEGPGLDVNHEDYFPGLVLLEHWRTEGRTYVQDDAEVRS